MTLQLTQSNKERLLGTTASAKADDSGEDQAPRARRRSASKVDAPLTVTVADAKRLTGIGCTKLYELLNDGRLRSTLVDGRRLVYYDSILEMLGLADQDAE